MSMAGLLLFIGTPSLAKAEVRANIYINPFAWFFPQPKVVKVVRPKYQVVEHRYKVIQPKPRVVKYIKTNHYKYKKPKVKYKYNKVRKYHKRNKPFKKRKYVRAW